MEDVSKSLVKYDMVVDCERILWEVRSTCIVSMNKQPTVSDGVKSSGKVWSALRIGRGTMSLAAAMASHVPPSLFKRFYENKEELALQIIGVSRKSFNSEQESLMEHGVLAEPKIRDWYSQNIIHCPIEEVGLAVWKSDPRFGGSLDGEMVRESDSGYIEEGIEIKAPKKMYHQLIEHCEAIKKGFTPAPGFHEHIFSSHYDQFTGNGVITGKKAMHYVVVANDGHGTAYYQRFPVRYDYWSSELYPRMCDFYDTYVVPAMIKHGVQRIDPPHSYISH